MKRVCTRGRSQKHIITIDGPAGAGKSTVAKMLSKKLGFLLLDTGALYRVMALHLIRLGIKPDSPRVPEELLQPDLKMRPDIASMILFLGSEDVTDLIRQEEIGVAASKFSALPEVRRALLGFQRHAATKWNLVAEGRDMGTVVFPDAQVKFFLTADVEERSRRRFNELLARGEGPDFQKVLTEMRERDERDISRKEAPLVQAPDAILIDSTNLEPEEVLMNMISHLESACIYIH